uniref:Uncharacterized protein n=1 Tax=Varanus komodoensis TaxID=61221 RepID=A0A8D2KVF5_VARKO
MVQVIVSRTGPGGLAEWLLLELQGELEARRGAGLAGRLLGDLHYTREVSGWLHLLPSGSLIHPSGSSALWGPSRCLLAPEQGLGFCKRTSIFSGKALG